MLLQASYSRQWRAATGGWGILTRVVSSEVDSWPCDTRSTPTFQVECRFGQCSLGQAHGWWHGSAEAGLCCHWCNILTSRACNLQHHLEIHRRGMVRYFCPWNLPFQFSLSWFWLQSFDLWWSHYSRAQFKLHCWSSEKFTQIEGHYVTLQTASLKWVTWVNSNLHASLIGPLSFVTKWPCNHIISMIVYAYIWIPNGLRMEANSRVKHSSASLWSWWQISFSGMLWVLLTRLWLYSDLCSVVLYWLQQILKYRDVLSGHLYTLLHLSKYATNFTNLQCVMIEHITLSC